MYLWDHLKASGLPVIIYGMGNGADKIFALCAKYDLQVSAIFASDDHVSGKLFHGLPVRSYDEICREYEQAAVLFAFGAYDGELLRRIDRIAERFSLYVPDLPLTGGPLLCPEWLDSHSEEIQSARSLLCDPRSLNCFDRVLEHKLSGEIAPLKAIETDRKADMQSLLAPGPGEHYLDLGAYNGDTIREFLSLTGGFYGSITAFEPDAHNYRKLSENTKDLHDVRIYPFAAWDHKTSLTFTGKGGRNAAVLPDLPGQYKHLHTVHAIPLDSLDLNATLIKFDIEGAEGEALQGMKVLLNARHPKLMVSVYHKTDDMVRIPLLIESLCPGYRMYLRKNPCLPAWELQLYCIYPEP